MKSSTLTTLVFLFIFTRVSFAVTISELSPVHPRPYLLPQTQIIQLQKLIEEKPWAQKSFDEIKHNAERGDGYSAAFLYALTNEHSYLSTAKRWLLKVAKSGGDLGKRALNADSKFFKQGMPWLGDVYYNIDTRPLQAFDLIYKGLSISQRKRIQNGLTASANFRKNAMDTWWQTPNLVFKPTSMVAIHGLLTRDPLLMDWGFFRESKSNLGGYFSSLNNMLKDNGPWAEAPIYAVSHRPLSLSLEISDYLNRLTGKDWFNRKLAAGSSVRGLMDYYIDTTYPAETKPNGSRDYRILTYGDGATGERGDLYLLSDNPHQRNLKQELASAYKISRDPDYAALLKFDEHYQPNLLNQPALPISPLLPPAPSSIWENFGLAFLRSDNSRNYWRNPNAMATSLLFRQGYGHGHSDALAMTFFAAGQLFYPDYNAVQYENPAVGWTASSVAHNTVVVNGMNSSLPKSVKTFHKYENDSVVAGLNIVQAQVKESLGLEKIRTLALTPNYLLDIFHINSLTPRTFDYLLHSFAKIQSDNETDFVKQPPFSPRYSDINNFKAEKSNDAWSVKFIMNLEQTSKRTQQLINQFTGNNTDKAEIKKAFGLDNTDSYRASGLSLNMAAQPSTQIGIGEDKYGLSFLAARRKHRKHTTFIATHSPFYKDGRTTQFIPEVLINNRTGTIVKIATDTSIEIHAVSHLKGNTRLSNQDASILAEFTDYAFLRINKKTLATDQSENWHGFSFSPRASGLNDTVSSGNIEAAKFKTDIQADAIIQINTYPDMVVLKDFANSEFTLSVTNLTSKIVTASATLTGKMAFDMPQSDISLGLIPAYQTYVKKINLPRYTESTGIDALPIHIKLDNIDQPVKHGIMVSVGAGLIETYDDINNPAYRIHTFSSSIDVSMRDGTVIQIMDNQDEVIYSGQPLFSLSDGQSIFSTFNENIDTSYTWPNKQQASVIAEINNFIRWHLITIQDRFYLKLDDVYTRTQAVSFVFDKTNPAIDWQQVQYQTDSKTLPLSAAASTQFNAKGIELPLKNVDKSICINNLASGQWINTDEKLGLLLKRENNEQWSFGICEKNTLTSWVH